MKRPLRIRGSLFDGTETVDLDTWLNELPELASSVEITITGTIEELDETIVDPNDLTVYSISQSNDRLVLIPVGTVAEGTICYPDDSVKLLFRVDRSEVTWAGSARPATVFVNPIL